MQSRLSVWSGRPLCSQEDQDQRPFPSSISPLPSREDFPSPKSSSPTPRSSSPATPPMPISSAASSSSSPSYLHPRRLTTLSPSSSPFSVHLLSLPITSSAASLTANPLSSRCLFMHPFMGAASMWYQTSIPSLSCCKPVERPELWLRERRSISM